MGNVFSDIIIDKKTNWYNQLIEIKINNNIIFSKPTALCICDYFEEIGYTSDTITLYEIENRMLSLVIKYPQCYKEINELLQIQK